MSEDDRFAQLERRVENLETRNVQNNETIEQLRSELTEVREQQQRDRRTIDQQREQHHALARENRELRKRLEDREDAISYDRDDEGNVNMSTFMVGDDPTGAHISNARHRVSDLEDQINQNGGVTNDVTNAENKLPIQNVTRIWKSGGELGKLKDEHAAAIWSDFFERASNGRGVRYLDTSDIKQILKEHFRHDDRHTAIDTNIERNTIHRAMNQIETFGGELITSDILKNGRRALMINNDEFQEFYESIAAVTDDVTASDPSGVTSAA